MPESITFDTDGLVVPDEPIIPYIEGDGTGPDIWASTVRVLDAAVEKAYGSQRRIAWRTTLAGQKAFDETGSWLPDETLEVFRAHLVGIKGPLTTPVGGGSGRSTSLCASNWISTCASDPCGGSRGCRAR